MCVCSDAIHVIENPVGLQFVCLSTQGVCWEIPRDKAVCWGLSHAQCPLRIVSHIVGKKTVCHPTGLSMTCIAALIMMQPDVGDELGRGGVGMGWAEVVLWVRDTGTSTDTDTDTDTDTGTGTNTVTDTDIERDTDTHRHRHTDSQTNSLTSHTQLQTQLKVFDRV